MIHVLSLCQKDIQAILAKAETLYEMGLFEKAMTQHYRGQKINSKFENNAFQTGIG